MVLLKRLLLPGKGTVISCILILFNVLCGETVFLVKASSSTAIVCKLSAFSFNYFPPNSYSYYSAVLATFNFISFQISASNAAETSSEVLIPKDLIQKPVLNKTDPLTITKRVREDDDFKILIINASDRSIRNSKSSLPLQYDLLTNENNDTQGSDKMRTKSLISSTANKSTLSRIDSPILTKRTKHRKPKLLKEITLLNRQNCLAKLLCGVQVAIPPTKASSAVNDYAYLVKTFFDRFSIRGLVTEALDAAFTYETESLDPLDDEEEDDLEGGRKKKRKPAGTGGRIKTDLENYKAKYYDEYEKDMEDLVEGLDELEEDDMPDFYHEHFRRRSGKNMTFVAPHITNNCSSNGKQLSKRKKVPNDINRVRRKRGILGRVKRGFLGFFNPRFDKTAYLNKRQLELETTENQGRQFNIAEEIAARLRSPRQCRLLNWFGTSNNNNNNANTQTQQGMTTTITTITNTGGMMGNGLERLNGAIPQANLNGGNMGNQGSQVVTVIQQSPTGAATNNNNPMAHLPTAATTTATTNGASNIASTIGSSICPFNTQELQALIMKAQNLPFPHFLTTTPPSPTRAVPLSTSTTGTTTTTTKATQAPPPPSTTLAVVVRQAPGSSRHSPQNYVNFYGNFDQQLQPIPTPFFSYKPHAELVPTVSIVGEDDEGDFDDDPYMTYERKNLMNKHHTNTLRRKAKPVPKWMTTTAAPRDDDYYLFNDAMPNYGYGVQGGYKVEGKQDMPARYIREPPVVVDSGKRYKSESNEIGQIQLTSAPPPPPSKKTEAPKKPISTDSEEESDEKDDDDDDGSSDEGSDDEGSDEETSSTSSDSRENRSNLNNIQMQWQNSEPPPPTPLPPRTVEASEEDDSSNEAEEKKDADDEEEDSEEDEENDRHGVRSYERNDFSKDRGGPPPATSISTTEKPSYQENNKPAAGGSVSGFISGFFNSFNPLNSLFRKNTKKISHYVTPSPTPIPPPRPLLLSSELSNETEDYDENDEESEEESEDEASNIVNEKQVSSLDDVQSSSFSPWSARQLSSVTQAAKSTKAPIVIEESGSWAERYKDQEDDSGEEGVFNNKRISDRKLLIENAIEKRWSVAAAKKSPQRKNQDVGKNKGSKHKMVAETSKSSESDEES